MPTATIILLRHGGQNYPNKRKRNYSEKHEPKRTVKALFPFFEFLKLPVGPFLLHGSLPCLVLLRLLQHQCK